jgi:CheY-like chemotaxis protein
MHAPTTPFAVRLSGFAPADGARIEAVLAQAPHTGPSYFCLHDDSLQEPDLYVANGDDWTAVARLAALDPGPLQPTVVVGGLPGQFAFPRLACPLDPPRLYEMLAQLMAQRAQALALLSARGLAPMPERRRRPRLEQDSGDPATYQAQRRPPPCGAVLIIDNGGAFRDHVARLLGQCRQPVEWTDSASAAVRLCDETPVSLVMVNTSTPGIDPYALCGRIKSQGACARTAVVLLVSHAFRYDSERARDAGVRGLLDKPVADRHLVAALQKLLSLPACP